MASNLKQLLALPTVMLCTGVIMAIVGLCLISAVVLLYFVKKQRVPTVVVREITYSVSSTLHVTRAEIRITSHSGIKPYDSYFAGSRDGEVGQRTAREENGNTLYGQGSVSRQ